MNLRIEAAAEAETREAAEWYERQRTGLGLEFLGAVDEAIQRIGLSPERFPRLETVPEEESVRRSVFPNNRGRPRNATHRSHATRARQTADAHAADVLHATILRQLGLDHTKLTFTHNGRPERLTDPDVTGARIVEELLA